MLATSPHKRFLLWISIQKKHFLNVFRGEGGQTSMIWVIPLKKYLPATASIYPVFLGSEPVRKTNKQSKRARRQIHYGIKTIKTGSEALSARYIPRIRSPSP